MLDWRLLPDLDSMKREMDSYSDLNQLLRHLDDEIPDQVSLELSDPYEDEDWE